MILSKQMQNAAAILFFLVLPFVSFAQNQKLQGIVKDQQGNPLQGVSVGIKGESNNIGAITAADGSFSLLLANANSKLTFSSVGFTQ